MRFYDFSKHLHHHPKLLLILYALFLTSSIPLASSEIKDTHIFYDSRSLIMFEQFGFTEGGQVSISIKDVSWKSKGRKAELNPSSMGFFLARDSSFSAIFMNDSLQSKDESFCVLSSRYVKLLFNFNELISMNTSAYNGSASIDEADEYSLVFGNCQPEFEVSMDVHTEMYNLQDGVRNFLPVGQTFLPTFFLSMFIIYTCFFGTWSFVCFKQRPTVDKIHLIMGALLCVKALKMICASEDRIYVSKTGTPHGWDVAFYIFGFFKGHNAVHCDHPDRNCETGPATKDWWTWNQIFLLIDVICCCAVFFPLVWSIRNLKEASKIGWKGCSEPAEANPFQEFLHLSGDPAERNPYLVIDEEEELVAEQILQDDDSFEL
ncbi:hypothetical protein OIU84_017807 [Salix udensis]|uniref:CAND6/7 N-terminal domain-containing protein n=1 Tax=Salix udensis TaxID=889485 RepID=A0AAD6L2W3_9ROSI|nr:hypothetical protein OIU84_017807 [Salix udensis]